MEKMIAEQLENINAEIKKLEGETYDNPFVFTSHYFGNLVRLDELKKAREWALTQLGWKESKGGLVA